MKRLGKYWIIILLVWPLCFGINPSWGENVPEQSQRFITIDFENVDINLFIKFISELTGKNFIVDKTVKGNVTVISPTQISEAEAYRVFESVLDVNGYTTIDAGEFIKIIPKVVARSENVRTFLSDEAEHPEDRIVTQLIPLKYTTPDEIKKVLAPLVSKTSVVIAHTQSGMLIITDTLSNIQRLMAIIDAIDVAYTGEEMVVLPLEHATATTVSKVLATLFQKNKRNAAPRAKKEGGGAAIIQGSTVKIVPYERINALIVVATPGDLERVKKLVTVLDAEMRKGVGNIHVFYLQNANAEEVAKVLNFLPGQQAEKDAKGKAPTISKAVKIMADKETNALIITAEKSEYQVLEGVIKKLDIPRRMVYLEALILEVSATKDFEVGVEWAMGGSSSDDTRMVTSGFSGSSAPFSTLSSIGEYAPAPVTGFSVGLLGTGINIGGITFPNIGAVLRAYKNDSDITIVSTPQILTTDNKEAEISVGENVPYLTGKETSQEDKKTYNKTYDYKDVSTKLTITPHINQAETLRLEIATEVVKLKDNTNNTPTTYKRTAKTTVIVKNNETVVIGGIIGQDSTKSNTRVPLLGDIPILGALFRTDAANQTRTNMFIFVTPKIIKNPAEHAAVTGEKADVVEEMIPGIKNKFVNDVNTTHAIHLCERGFDMMQQGKNEEAKDFFEEALEIDPQNPYALYNMGVLYEEAGSHEAARRMYQQVILTGTAMTAKNTGNSLSDGVSLIQLARERIEGLGEEKKTRRPDIYNDRD